MRRRVKHHEGCKIVKYETRSAKTLIVSDEICWVRYDLNLTFRCLRFYYLAPLQMLGPTYLYLDLIRSKSDILSSYLVISCIVTIHTLALETERQVSLWRAFHSIFKVSTHSFEISRQCIQVVFNYFNVMHAKWLNLQTKRHKQ